MKNVDAYIEMYKDSYINKKRERLPKTLISKEDTKCRLYALYILAVQSRGGVCINDENTMSKIDKVTEWLHSSDRRGLFLCGNIGNGKTTMIRAIGAMFRYKAVTVEAEEIYYNFRNTERPYYYPDNLLLIDDLGAEPERCNVFGVDYHPLSDLLLNRYARNLTTVIATNLTYEEFKSRYGDRVYDRLLEMFIALEYDAPSYRGRV